ncbi:NRDE family protein [Motiliproteus sp. SC1-56]|uniref:NRDE family protein n=1 Tax=Motiliproteus sp. SC1-56 TaxID=2799565 RepID=UPI001A8EF5FE|nr:NRDE family protein [Motiliproteus sp. SC1-56]
MCLIAFAYRVHPRYPLILVANRDEFYERPTRRAHFWPEHPDLLAGQDLVQGGTWLGVTRQGRLAAVTNVRDGRRPADPRHRSRGSLTRGFLQGAQPAAPFLEELTREPDAYGGFNLLLGDGDGLYFYSNRDGCPPQPLGPGVYGLSNATLNTPWPKVQTLKAGLEKALSRDVLAARDLLPLLQNRHSPEDAQLPDTGVGLDLERTLAPCFIHGETYGTRASTVLTINADNEVEFLEQNYDATGAGDRHCERLTLTG